MKIRRWIPHIRVVAFVAIGITVGAFIGSMLWAVLDGHATPRPVQTVTTWIAYLGLASTAVALALDRRRGLRRHARDAALTE